MRHRSIPCCLAMLVAAGLLGGCAATSPLPQQPQQRPQPGNPALLPTSPSLSPPSPFPLSSPSAVPASPSSLAVTAPVPALSAPVPVSPVPVAGPPAFATVIKDARRVDGPLVLWQREEKVWIELLPAQFNQPFLLSPKIKSGISEAWVLGGLMAFSVNGAGGQQVVEFVRVHNQVRLQARNTDVMARAGTPEARAVADSYSNSLLASVPVVSQPHPDRKSVLVEAHAIFLNDMLGIGMMLQRGLRQGYGLERSNSLVTAARGSAMASTIETQNHYFSASVGAPAVGPVPGAPSAALPRFLPDTRSMLVSLVFSLAPLPAVPMTPRRADPRLGLFTSTVLDFSDDLQLSPRQRHVNRWRLEKKEPAATLSEPVTPITFWVDRNVPLAYRDTVRGAILEWNKAFEKIGISGAIRVEQQADDAAFDTLDFGYASVRWMMNADPVFGAIGPTHVDPRTGEILDADIGFEGMSARSVRGLRSQVLAPRVASGGLGGPFVPPGRAPTGGGADLLADGPGAADAFGADTGARRMPPEAMRCLHGPLAAEQLGYALDILEAQGHLDPEGPTARQFLHDYIRESIMHEVGHALGLRHNFRASRAYTEAQLADAEFTRANGTTGSVMEYNAVNLPMPGQTGGTPFQTALGPYDYWAIEYAYRPMAPGTSPADERAELQRIAARGSEPLLAFGTDEDIFYGLDPETIQLDLGSDPVAFAAKRLAIARDLFRRQETRVLSPDRDYAVLRRSLAYAIADVTRAIGVLARQIGGVRTLRDFPGTGRDPLQPVPAPVQRRALALMADAVLSPEGFALSPALQRRLAPDYLDRADFIGDATDFALPQRLLDLQRAVLGYLLSEGVAARVIDSSAKVDRPREALQLAELYQRLSDGVWHELGSVGAAATSIGPARRELQRTHVNRVAAALLRPAPSARADARSHLRLQAGRLLGRLEAARGRPTARAGLDVDTRAHLADSIDTLRQALSATIQRQSL